MRSGAACPGVRGVALVVAVGAVLVGTSPLAAERPSAPKLLPDTTLAYVRVDDTRDLIERFNQTAFGQMFEDEKIKPLVIELYGAVTQAFAQVQDRIGVSLSELLSIPQGEACLALVGRAQGPPALFFLLEVGESSPVARQLLDLAEEQMVRGGASRQTEQVGDTTITVMKGVRGVDQGDPAYFERDGVILGSNHVELLKEILKVWDGDSEVKTLADNREFLSIMERSVGTKDERPQVSWFADPIEIFTHFTRDNVGGQIALAMLPTLGLDGIKSVGGSMIFATEEFDSIQYMHLLLDSPRQGILKMIAIESGDLTPEPWVPRDAASYMSVYWNPEQTLEAFRKLYETMRGEGALSNDIKRNMSSRLEIDVEKEILQQIDDRLTMVSWFEKPARLNSGTNLIGVKLKDASAMRQTIDNLAVRFNQVFTKKRAGDLHYYVLTPRRRRQQPDNELIRQPTPCLAVVGDYFLFSDSVQCLETAINNKRDPNKSLGNELDFKLIASKAKQYLGSTSPGGIVFSRPEETMRSFYDLATSPGTRRQLSDAAQRNDFFKSVDQALRDHPLPPFSVIARYLSPAGGTLVSDQSGIHYMAFTLKRELATGED